jgi:hypothetical protein
MRDGEVAAYDAYENILTFVTPEKMRSFKARPMDLATYCAMLGYRIESSRPEGELAPPGVLAELFGPLQSAFVRVRRTLLNGEIPQRSDRKVLELLESIGILENGRLGGEGAANRLSGGLFEEHIYWLCKAFGFDDLAIGCVIDWFPNIRGEAVHPRQEFDILFMHDNRIGTIECKFSHRIDGWHYLLKYDTIIDYFGYTSRALIVNMTQRPKHKKRKENFPPHIVLRSYLGNVRIYHDLFFQKQRFLKSLKDLLQIL